MPSAGSITVDLAMNTVRFEQGVKSANQKISTFERKAKRSFQNASQATNQMVFAMRRLLVPLAALAGAGGIGALTVRLNQQADAIGKTADKLGLGVEAYQEWSFAASQASIKQATFDMALQRFGRRVGEASLGTGEAVKAFKLLNISATDATGRVRGLNDILPEFLEKLGKIEDANLRNALAMKGFDSEGVVMVNLVEKLNGDFETFRNQARELGAVLSEETVRGAEQANEKLTIMRRIIGVQLTEATNNLMPLILGITGAFVDMSEAVNTALMRMGLVDSSLEELMKKRAGLAQELEEAKEGQGIASFFGVGDEDVQKVLEQIDILDEQIIAKNMELLERKEEQRQQELQSNASHLNALTQQEVKAAKDRAKLEQQVSKSIVGMKQNVVRSAIGLLRTLAGDNKAFAIATIALEKGLNIAMAIQNTAVAVTRALAFDPTGAMAARVAALGKIQIGIIAATGLAEAFGGGGGGGIGGGGGTVASPTDIAAQELIEPVETQRPTEVTINLGDDDQIITVGAIRRLIDEINDQIDDGVILRT